MYYVASNHVKFVGQLKNFSNKIGNYASLFQLDTAEVESIQKDSAFFEWTVLSVYQLTNTKQGFITYRNLLRNGVDTAAERQIPQMKTFEPIPEEVSPGIQYRFTSMVNRIKSHAAYTSAIGKVLGIELSYHQRIDLDGVKPSLNAIITGQKVVIKWKKGDYDAILIEKNSGQGFEVFDKSLRPNFVDPTVIPQANQSTVWYYRAMYLYREQRVGKWSDVITVVVGG